MMNTRLMHVRYVLSLFHSIPMPEINRRRAVWRLTLFCSSILISVNSLSTTQIKQRPRIPILQYHDGWVCVNKPNGITVHRGKGTPKHTAVLSTTVKRQLARKVFPVHRLDHRTSGAMIFAFDSETAGVLHNAAIREGRKKYIALVRGEWAKNNAFEKGNNDGESVVIVDKPLEVKGITKDAVTKFTLLGATRGETTNDRCSLLLCEPLTGRTHQIRRHLFSIGHPIIGDSQHGDNAFNRWWRKHRSLNRLALHCWTIDFELEGASYECLAPLSPNLKAVLERLQLWEESLLKEPQLALDHVDKVDGTHGRNYQNRLNREEEQS
mmetsp:Transcript_23470/g.51370  ORF Transcript_23470/g.51370 Transcript_23470/m.51370 type:complete len:324 (+) Transcript_23470:146-1117(+)